MKRARAVHVALAVSSAVLFVGGVVAFLVSRSPAARPTLESSVRSVILAVSPADGANGVRLDAPVVLSATQGELGDVAVTAASGAATPAVSRNLGPEPKSGPTLLTGTGDSRQWRSSAPLEPGTTYTVAATVVDAAGQRQVRKSTFTTLNPAKVLKVGIGPLDGQTVGIGMPLALYLTSPVQDHAAFERRLSVTTTPTVAGAWHWFSDTELHYRPQAYWPAGTKVTVQADVAAFDDGGGVWAVTPRTMSFSIGDAHVSTVDAGSHTMTVTSGGTVLRTVPVSTGRDQYPTDSGIHVVSEKEPQILMDSATVGIPRNSPDGYYETVDWDVRISNSGEFVHAAPWSLDDQGHNNVSHGCVNVSPDDAHWFFDFSVPGDIVSVVGTPKQLAPTNGYGDWNVPWSQWVAQA
ncbi:MAG TPA: Ig-like domain-containing protein [Acidimicrobiales bacterium]|jgi:lipoprotein-anchoring transpeptidase ErfK/SrfK|nr:Ig-like domain-containing protein [Acidimicrobiales bacterium]